MKLHPKPYLTPNEVAERLMVAPGTVRVWAEKGLLLAHTTVGGHRRFPVEEVERFQRDHGMAAPAGRLSRRALRVLVVDDDAALGRYLRAWLGSLGVEVEVAGDGFAAGRALIGFQPDVMLLDLLMPGLDGFDVCEQVKADPATQGIRVVAMTGDPSEDNVRRILAAGADRCLAKPLDEAELAETLGLALDAAQAVV